MFQDLARMICLIDVRFDKAASDWITLQEENSSCKFGALQGIKVVRAGSYHTRPENQANDFEKVYYTSISDACPFCCGVNLPIGKLTIQLQEIEDTQHGYLVSSHLTVSLSSLHLM